MKKILLFLLLVPFFASCDSGELEDTEWVSVSDAQTLSFTSDNYGEYGYITYDAAGEPYHAEADFTYHYFSNGQGDMHVKNVMWGGAVNSYDWSFVIANGKLHLRRDRDEYVFVKK